MTARSDITVRVHGISRRSKAIGLAWDRIVAAMSDREFVAVVCFCAIGLLLTAGVGHSLGNIGVVAVSLGLMP
jgi:predicted histidine transporter YuiF (NhaC family)